MRKYSLIGTPLLLIVTVLALFFLPSHKEFAVNAQAPSAYPYAFTFPNDTTTGTTQFSTACMTASGQAVTCLNTATNGYLGVCVANCQVGSTGWFTFIGQVPLTMENTSTIQHYITYGSTTAGDGHDTGATSYPGANAVIGRVVIGAAAAAKAQVMLFPPEILSASLINGTPTTNQIAVWSSATQVKGLDLPQSFFVPSANCSNTTAGPAWSIGSGGTSTCRAGTNNKGGYIPITDTAGTYAQFTIAVPFNNDASTLPYIRFYVASADTTSGHTIIPAIQVSCAASGGTTTDDVTFNASHSSSTVTLNTTANQFWSTSNVQMNSTDFTGCSAGSLMIVQVGRATDTATSAFFYGANVTFFTQPVIQAN